MTLLVIIQMLLLVQPSSTTVIGNITNNSTDEENPCFLYKPQSCFGVCGQFFDVWCSCDEYCQAYGRCCFDYQTVCDKEAQKSRQDHKALMTVTKECQTDIKGRKLPQQIITGCPQVNYSSDSVQLCEDGNKSSSDMLKVMSQKTQLHYKNIYCMLCNGEVEDDVVYWSTVVGTTSRRERPNSLEDILKCFNNSVAVIPPTNSREIICFPYIISSCPNNSAPEEESLCQENVLSPVKYYHGVFKNTFCLQCNVDLQLTANRCYLARKNDMYYGQIEQYQPISITFKWKKNREALAVVESQSSYIRNLICSLDSDYNLAGCKITKCVGTLQVVNQSCSRDSDHLGCIHYFFEIDFNVPSSSSPTNIIQYIVLKLDMFADDLENTYNITKYHSQKVWLRDINVIEDRLTGLIVLYRLAYNPCFSDLEHSMDQYIEYVNTYLDINLNGSVTTCRYIINCHNWCDKYERTKCHELVMFQKYFTKNIVSELDIKSTANTLKFLCIYKLVFLLMLY